MADDEYFDGIPYLEDVIEKLKPVLKHGFGEVRVIIRNGVICNIIPAPNYLMEEKKPK